MTSERNAHRTLYNRIPHMTCKAGCSDCCGPVPVDQWEARRLGISGPTTPVKPGTLTCAFVCDDGGCTVYSKRPYICRLFGSADDPRLSCPHGCTARKPLTVVQADELTKRYMELR